MIRAICAWLFLSGLAALPACAPVGSAPPAPESTTVTNRSTLFPYTEGDTDRLRRGLDKPVTSTIALDLGAKLIEVKATYTEARASAAAPSAGNDDKVKKSSGNSFDLLASSSRFDGKLIGESEFAYAGAALNHQLPAMSRFTLRGKWGDANYGASYRNFGSGFVSSTGLKFDNDRNEREAWGEYDFKVFRFKSSWAESWERRADTGLLALARTAATSFNLSRGVWSALMISSYSITGQSEAALERTNAFNNALSIAYRPTSFLTIEPSLQMKQEWSQLNGLKTDTPSGGVALVSTPLTDVSLTGRASFARGFSEDPLKESSLMNAGAGLNWSLGKSFLGEQALSLQFEYSHQMSANPLAAAPPSFNGMIQWKLAGF